MTDQPDKLPEPVLVAEIVKPHERRKIYAYTADQLRAAILAAKMEERNRCIRICEALDSAEEEGWSSAASAIAYDIRRG